MLVSTVLILCVLVGDVKVVLNEGMPHLRNPFDKGRLIIPFTVSITYYVWGGFKWSCRWALNGAGS